MEFRHGMQVWVGKAMTLSLRFHENKLLIHFLKETVLLFVWGGLFFIETESCYISQAGLKLAMWPRLASNSNPSALASQCWDYRCVSSCLTRKLYKRNGEQING
jgi:hypothetical protein